jgi:hypothetical protein
MIYSDDNVHEALEKVANVSRFKMYLRMLRDPKRAAKMAYPGKSSSWIKKFLSQMGYAAKHELGR